MHRLLFYNPGHFHAALLLRDNNPRIDPEIYVYGPSLAEMQGFLDLLNAFNKRADNPTNWKINCHTGDDVLEKLLAEQPGDVVVLAGKNAPKLDLMSRLHAAGLALLVDKPWITDAAQLIDLEVVMAGPPLAMDIMTSRHDPLTKLRQRVIANDKVFGDLGGGDPALPAIEIGSRHHLMKIVNGQPLRRPAWVYDVAVQGDGLVDIQSHMCDQAQWLVEQLPGTAEPFDFARDISELQAERWTTPVDLALFQESTGESVFPENLTPAVSDGILHLACNGQIDYRLRGIWVRQRADWGQREPSGGGDVHSFIARGSKASLQICHGEQTGFRTELHLVPNTTNGIDEHLDEALTTWGKEFPGVELASSDLGYELKLPEEQLVSHEGHFPLLLNDFLDHLESGEWQAADAARIKMRYSLLAKAQQLAAN